MYGPDQIRKFLKYELDNYLRRRGGELIEELPLDRVEDQPYIHYQKGSLAMYLLKDVIGEDAVNRALQGLLGEFAFKAAPYPTSKDLLRHVRAAAGPEHQQLITDLFQKITLYDVKVTGARKQPRADGMWDVALDIDARKALRGRAGPRDRRRTRRGVRCRAVHRGAGHEGIRSDGTSSCSSGGRSIRASRRCSSSPAANRRSAAWIPTTSASIGTRRTTSAAVEGAR